MIATSTTTNTHIRGLRKMLFISLGLPKVTSEAAHPGALVQVRRG
jgi:hypothetical protein